VILLILLDGKKYRDELLEEYKNTIKKENLDIRLDIILVGNDSASEIYVKNKLLCAEKIGIKAILHPLDENTSEDELIDLIHELNEDREVTGIILQSPTPESIDFDKCANEIVSNKDIDGFTKENINNLYHNRETILPCTVKGIIKLLEHYGIALDGKNVTIIGRSKIVGLPLALALENKNATVTLCHSHTKDLENHTKNADILISAVGQAGLIEGDMVKEGFIGVDVGITRVDKKVLGDFDFESTSPKASYITPVPGGVGPMTVAMIMDNLIFTKKREKR